MITASQLNRTAVDEIEFDHSHIAGGISKINTADYVFGIFTSRSMRERGKYQIQCMKSRSSTGVGTKIDLDYNIETMRITDDDTDEQVDEEKTETSVVSANVERETPPGKVLPKSSLPISQRIMQDLREHNKSVVVENKQPMSQETKLKSLLNTLKS